MKREVKIGIFALLMLGCAWAGIRFLSGIDIFSRNNEYYAAYDQIGGVQAASPVIIRGVKVGTVTDIEFDPARSEKVVLQLTVKRQIRIPKDSEAKIVSSSIMGSKSIEIRLGDDTAVLADGDTLRSGRDRDLMDMAGSELDFVKQRVAQLTDSLTRTLGGINALVAANAAGLTGTIDHLNGITGNVDELLVSEREALRSTLRNLSSFSGRLDSIGDDLGRMTSRLADDAFMDNLTGAAERLNGVLAALDSEEGSAGLLLNDPELYRSLTEASDRLGALLADLKEHPKRYVHFSLFGRSEEKERARAEKRAARSGTQTAAER